MNSEPDADFLEALISEIRQTLPQIGRLLHAHIAQPGDMEQIEEVYRLSHSIKGASSMVGLESLSQLGEALEFAAEEVGTNPGQLSADFMPRVDRTLACIEAYISRCAEGAWNDTSSIDAMWLEWQPLITGHTKANTLLDGLDEPTDSKLIPMEDLQLLIESPSFETETEHGMPVDNQPAESTISTVDTDENACQEADSAAELLNQLSEAPATTEETTTQDQHPWLDASSEASSVDGYARVDNPTDQFPLVEHSSIDVAQHAVELPLDVTGELAPDYAEMPDYSEPSAASGSGSSEDIPAELLEIFMLEAEEHLRTITNSLPELEAQPENMQLITEIRRSSHTLKGSAAMVGFGQITDLAHRMEDLLDEIAEGQRRVTPGIIQLLFRSADALEDLSARRPVSIPLATLYAEYATLLQSKSREAAVENEQETTEKSRLDTTSDLSTDPDIQLDANPESVESAEPVDAVQAAGEAALNAIGVPVDRKALTGQYLRVPIRKLDDLIRLVGELVINRSEFEQKLGDFVHQVAELNLSSSRLRRAANKLETEYEAKTLASGRVVQNPRFDDRGAKSPIQVSNLQSYGFDDLEFDRYTDFHLLSRELSETTTDIQTVSNELKNLGAEFEANLTRQNRVGSDLQDRMMRLRMVPLATLQNRLERTVRNAADVCEKQVKLQLEGENTELDKTVLEEMQEPLLHILRNAVDHGLESPAERLARGKSSTGHVRVRAFPEGTQVVIQIIDDGRGIDKAKICSLAVTKGLITKEQATSLTDAEVYELLFQPGFTTAKKLSQISGRGVGLDIVRAQVQRLKGTVSINSQVGMGTVFTIRLPLTLAVTRALMVRASGQVFAMPLGAVTQILRLEDAIVEEFGQERLVRLKERIYPYVSLAGALNLKETSEVLKQSPPVLLVRTGDEDIAVVVDEILGGREIVVKNLGSFIGKAQGISGATIAGDGSVILIVNPSELRRTYKPVRMNTQAKKAVSEAFEAADDQPLNVLVVDDSPSVRRIVTGIFKRAGWESFTAKDGVEALELLQSTEKLPDAIMLDIEMPRMDGYEFLSTIRSQSQYRHLPVVMVTSRAGDKHRRKAIDLGANAYLVKPYQDEKLLTTIRGIVAESLEYANGSAEYQS